MKRSHLLLAVIALPTLSGCAFMEALLEVEPSVVYPAVVGGDRSAGMVTVVYDTWTKNVQYDAVQVYHSVKARCEGWGYADAKVFDLESWQCIEVKPGYCYSATCWPCALCGPSTCEKCGPSTCGMYRVTTNWQCLG